MNARSSEIVEVVSLLASFALIVRLLSTKLHRVYRVFSLYLVIDILINAYALIESSSAGSNRYLVAWLIYKPLTWILYLWIVYDLLDGIWSSRPGILKFSQRLSITVFGLAAIVAAISASPEYAASPLNGILRAALVIDRAICTLALLVLVSILGFLLWFPIKVSRNLAIFSVGFVLYFASKTALLLILSFVSHDSYTLISRSLSCLSAACFLCWAFLVTSKGESIPVNVGFSLTQDDRARLIGQLDAMNASLLRSVRR